MSIVPVFERKIEFEFFFRVIKRDCIDKKIICFLHSLLNLCMNLRFYISYCI